MFCVRVGRRVLDRAADVDLRRQVVDDLGPRRRERRRASRRRRSRRRARAARRARAPARGSRSAAQVVDDRDLVARVEQRVDEVRADEPRAAGDERPHRRARQLALRRGAAGGGGGPARPAGRRRPPTAARATSAREHDVEPHDLGRQLERVLRRRRRSPGTPAARRPRSSRSAPRRSARRARSRNHTPTAASPKNVAVLPWRWIAQSSVSAPCQVMPLDDVAGALAARVRPGGGGDRAAGQRRRRPGRSSSAHGPGAQRGRCCAAARPARTSPATRARRTRRAAASRAGSA